MNKVQRAEHPLPWRRSDPALGAPSPAGQGSGRRPQPHPQPRQLRTHLPSVAAVSRPRSAPLRSLLRALPARPSLKETARAAALPRLASSHWRLLPARPRPLRRRGQGRTNAKEHRPESSGTRPRRCRARGIRGCPARVGHCRGSALSFPKSRWPGQQGQRLVGEQGTVRILCIAQLP